MEPVHFIIISILFVLLELIANILSFFITESNKKTITFVMMSCLLIALIMYALISVEGIPPMLLFFIKFIHFLIFVIYCLNFISKIKKINKQSAVINFFVILFNNVLYVISYTQYITKNEQKKEKIKKKQNEQKQIEQKEKEQIEQKQKEKDNDDSKTSVYIDPNDDSKASVYIDPTDKEEKNDDELTLKLFEIINSDGDEHLQTKTIKINKMRMIYDVKNEIKKIHPKKGLDIVCYKYDDKLKKLEEIKDDYSTNLSEWKIKDDTIYYEIFVCCAIQPLGKYYDTNDAKNDKMNWNNYASALLPEFKNIMDSWLTTIHKCWDECFEFTNAADERYIDIQNTRLKDITPVQNDYGSVQIKLKPAFKNDAIVKFEYEGSEDKPIIFRNVNYGDTMENIYKESKIYALEKLGRRIIFKKSGSPIYPTRILLNYANVRPPSAITFEIEKQGKEIILQDYQ